MNLVSWLSSAKSANESNIIAWWETRRIPFNAIVGAVGIVSLILMFWIGANMAEHGTDFIEPLAAVAGVVFAGIGFNLYYTQAWVAERNGAAAGDHCTYRERVFRTRLLRSCQIATLPLWIALLAWAAKGLS